jgi:hypothetical protein
MNIFSVDGRAKRTMARVDAYDSHLKHRFNLHDAYLWSIHDYLAYVKFVSWCVHSRLNCPICMDDSNAVGLEHCKKVSFLIVIKDSFQ